MIRPYNVLFEGNTVKLVF